MKSIRGELSLSDTKSKVGRYAGISGPGQQTRTSPELELPPLLTTTPKCNNRIVVAQRKHLEDFLRVRIIGRLECRRTHLEEFDELGIAQSVISRLLQRFQDDGNVSRCYSTGSPRGTTLNEDRYLAVTARRNRRSTASDMSRQLSSATGMTVSRQTVYRSIGLYARRTVRCVTLTTTHCHLRLTWSRGHAF
ncbi:transposable element Tcb2 transposase [Trichonephila clavipes]|nr:transposable element Tcb2 transposase [Trichonephila clavipes]